MFNGRLRPQQVVGADPVDSLDKAVLFGEKQLQTTGALPYIRFSREPPRSPILPHVTPVGNEANDQDTSDSGFH